jgi:hypothetical protein
VDEAGHTHDGEGDACVKADPFTLAFRISAFHEGDSESDQAYRNGESQQPETRAENRVGDATEQAAEAGVDAETGHNSADDER